MSCGIFGACGGQFLISFVGQLWTSTSLVYSFESSWCLIIILEIDGDSSSTNVFGGVYEGPKLALVVSCDWT